MGRQPAGGILKDKQLRADAIEKQESAKEIV